jgi:hypothetical protein
MCEIGPEEISELIQLRWLQRSERDDHAAVEKAFRSFVGYALDVTRNTVR